MIEVVSGQSADRAPEEAEQDGAGGPRTVMRQARKLVILVVGSTVVAVGVAMLLLPGPAFLVIPAGIAILATEFAWARHLLRRVKAQIGLGSDGESAGEAEGPPRPPTADRPEGHV